MAIRILHKLFDLMPSSLKTETVLKSISDQIKILSWAMGGINYIMSSKLYSLIFIIPVWILCQILAHYLLTRIGNLE